jgi:hypothetical protein
MFPFPVLKLSVSFFLFWKENINLRKEVSRERVRDFKKEIID